MATAPAQKAPEILNEAEVERFARDGFVGPFPFLSRAEVARHRRAIEDEVLTGDDLTNRHLDNDSVRALCTNSQIVARARHLLGPPIKLWMSTFFVKEPGALGIPWHQDAAYWHLDPMITVSAWMALDDATIENSCLHLIPGSQGELKPTIREAGWAFKKMVDPQYVDAAKAQPMEVEAGSFFLFTDRVMHYSAPNRSAQRRMGLTARFTPASVQVHYDRFNIFRDKPDKQRAILLDEACHA